MAGQSDAVALDATSESCWALWQRVRAQRPLIHCITNFVSMDIMANVLLAAGCSPAMVRAVAGGASQARGTWGTPLDTQLCFSPGACQCNCSPLT